MSRLYLSLDSATRDIPGRKGVSGSVAFFTTVSEKVDSSELSLQHRRAMLSILTALVIFVPLSNNYDPRIAVIQPYNAKLERMAYCETHYKGHARWFLNTGNGFYGGLQFDKTTWKSVGGKKLPHQNSKREQKYRAVLLIRKRGYQPWPVCGSA